jgi:pimeloyl-ACP methyl ester carboxylesterase
VEALERFVARDGGSERARKVRRAFDDVWSAPDDETLTRLLKELFPAYFADYFGRQAEFEPLLAGLRAWCEPLRREGPSFDVTGELEELAAAALVVAGRHDFICGPRWTRLLLEALPHAESVVLERSGHFGHLEEPELFARPVADFIERVERDAARREPGARATQPLSNTMR